MRTGELGDDEDASAMGSRQQIFLRMGVQSLRKRGVQIEIRRFPERQALLHRVERAGEQMESHRVRKLRVARRRRFAKLRLVRFLPRTAGLDAARPETDLNEDDLASRIGSVLEKLAKALQLEENPVDRIQLVHRSDDSTVPITLLDRRGRLQDVRGAQERRQILPVRPWKRGNRGVESDVGDVDAHAARSPLETDVAVALDALRDAEMATAGADEMASGAVGVGPDEIRRQHAAKNRRAERQLAEHFVRRERQMEEEDDANALLLRLFFLQNLQRLLSLLFTPLSLATHAVIIHQRVLRAQRVQLLPSGLSFAPTSILSSSRSSSKLSTNSGPDEYNRSPSRSSIEPSREGTPPTGDSGTLSSRGEYSEADEATKFPETYMLTRESEQGIVVRDLPSIPRGNPTSDSAWRGRVSSPAGAAAADNR